MRAGVVLPIVCAFFQVALSQLPDEQPDLFEGDIELAPSEGFRSALGDRARLWENGIIPYEISEKAYFLDDQMANITAAMEEFHKHTCIRWVPRTNQESYIRFQNGNGCSSNVGRLRLTMLKFTQRIMLGWGCFNKGVIMHEMMHATGFFHEQSRWDRDTYVRIQPQNIKQGLLDQFRVHKLQDQHRELGPYDYGSLMHYRKNTFSREGEDTIVPLKEGVEIGQRDGFSELDIYKINKLYNCPGSESITPSPDAYTTPATPDSRARYPMSQKSSFECTFDEKSACDFHDEISSDLDWKVNSGPSSRNGETGPPSDAFDGECCYMHINTVGHQPGESARLVSPFLKARTSACLTFWYHMKGQSIGTLRVYIRDYRGEKGDVVFEKTGEQSSRWLKARVPVENMSPFQLVFEATVGDAKYASYMGNIAIDEVKYQDMAGLKSWERC